MTHPQAIFLMSRVLSICVWLLRSDKTLHQFGVVKSNSHPLLVKPHHTSFYGGSFFVTYVIRRRDSYFSTHRVLLPVRGLYEHSSITMVKSDTGSANARRGCDVDFVRAGISWITASFFHVLVALLHCMASAVRRHERRLVSDWFAVIVMIDRHALPLWSIFSLVTAACAKSWIVCSEQFDEPTIFACPAASTIRHAHRSETPGEPGAHGASANGIMSMR